MNLFTYKRSRGGHCGCLSVLLILMLVVLCALAAIGVAALVRGTHPAHAQEPVSAREYVILVDRSNSVMNSSPVQSLTTQTTLQLIQQLREHAIAADTVSVVLFGNRMSTVVTPTALEDDKLAARVQALLVADRSMGGTLVADALSNTLKAYPVATDVILVTDGIPSLANESSVTERTTYTARLREIAADYAQRHVTLTTLLVGSTNGDWASVWRVIADTTGGVYAEIATAADLLPDLGRIEQRLTPTPTPQRATETPASPTATRQATSMTAPAKTPVPVTAAVQATQPVGTVIPTATSNVSVPAGTTQVPSTPWAAIVAGVGICLLLALLLVRAIRRPKAIPPQSAPVDGGVLEKYDAETDDVERVELSGLGLGEVWLIGPGPQCQIHLNGARDGQDVQAALTMTEDGPIVESRGVPMYVEGRAVQTHRLFDGDHLYLDRFVLYYHNFFRQRVALDEEL